MPLKIEGTASVVIILVLVCIRTYIEQLEIDCTVCVSSTLNVQYSSLICESWKIKHCAYIHACASISIMH